MHPLPLALAAPLPFPAPTPEPESADGGSAPAEPSHAAATGPRADPGLEEVVELARRTAEGLFGSDSPLVGRVVGELSDGKRLRARLPLQVRDALSRPDVDVFALAAATEVLHTASLVHDDLQDGDRTRRGRAAAWVRYGRGEAILLGDALIFLARALLGQLRAADAVRLRVGRRFDLACAAAVDGQQRELELRREPPERLTARAWTRVARGKTAALLELPLVAAAELCGADAEELEALEEVAGHFGTAFQIRDDVLDFLGAKEGRGPDADLLEGKRGVLVAHAVERLGAGAGRRLLRVLDLPRSSKTPAVLAGLRSVLSDHGLEPALRTLATERSLCRAATPRRLRPLIDDLLRALDHPALASDATPAFEGRGAGLGVRIVRSVAAIEPGAWDRWPATTAFATTSWLRFAERFSAGDQEPVLARIHDRSSGEEVGRAVCQLVRSDVAFFRSRAASALFARYLRSRPLLVCRRPLFGASRCGLATSPVAAGEVVATIVRALEAEARRLGAAALVFDGLDEAGARALARHLPLGFHYAEPTHRLSPVPGDLEDHLDALPRRHRADLRRQLRRGRERGHRVLRFDRVDDPDTAWALIERAHARYNRSPLPPLVRRVLEQAPSENLSFHLVVENGAAIACGAMLVDRGTGLLTHYGSVDGARYAYFELFASMIREAGERGLDLLDAGTGLGELKRRLGFTAHDCSYGRLLPLAPELRLGAGILGLFEAPRLGGSALDLGSVSPLRTGPEADSARRWEP